MKMLNNLLFFFLLISPSINVISQVSINAGTGFLSGFSSEEPGVFVGFHLGGEVPRNNDVTFYGRFSHYLNRRGNEYTSPTYLIDFSLHDPITGLPPTTINVDSYTLTNMTSIEGGTRYYLGNGFDNGFSIYGGSNMALSFYGVKSRIDDYDTTLYYPIGDEGKGTIISLSLGLQGGVKYTMPSVGTIYFDITGCYAILAQANNAIGSSTPFYSPLLFGFNIGFRKDFY